MHERAIACMECEVGGGQGLIAFQIVRTYLDTQSSIEHDYLAIACMECEVGGGQGLIAFQIVRTYLDTQSSIEHDYLPPARQ